MAAWSLLIVLVGLHVVAAGLVLTHATQDVFADLDWMRNTGRDATATRPPAADDCGDGEAAPAPGDEEAPLAAPTHPPNPAGPAPSDCRRDPTSND